jgi:hypothetical protein
VVSSAHVGPVATGEAVSASDSDADAFTHTLHDAGHVEFIKLYTGHNPLDAQPAHEECKSEQSDGSSVRRCTATKAGAFSSPPCAPASDGRSF